MDIATPMSNTSADAASRRRGRARFLIKAVIMGSLRCFGERELVVFLQSEHRFSSEEPAPRAQDSYVIDLIALDLGPSKAINNSLHIEFPELALQKQQRLVGSIGLHTEVDDLKGEVRPGPQLADERLFVSDAVAKGEGIAHEEHARRSRIGVIVRACNSQTKIVKVHRHFRTFLAKLLSG